LVHRHHRLEVSPTPVSCDLLLGSLLASQTCSRLPFSRRDGARISRPYPLRIKHPLSLRRCTRSSGRRGDTTPSLLVTAPFAHSIPPCFRRTPWTRFAKISNLTHDNGRL
ncbi:unnamed protein product, partial [Scytosiphon promiscuus]